MRAFRTHHVPDTVPAAKQCFGLHGTREVGNNYYSHLTDDKTEALKIDVTNSLGVLFCSVLRWSFTLVV